MVSLGPIPVCLFRRKIPYRQRYDGMLVSSTVLAFTVIKINLEGFVAQRQSDASFMHVHTIHITSDVACFSLLLH